MTTITSDFSFLIMFNKSERATALRQATNGLIGVNLDNSGDSLTFDTEDTGYSAEIASRQVLQGRTMPETSRYLLRDHAECRRTAKYEGSLLHAFIVGIVTDQSGAPVMTFEAHKQATGWRVSGKKFKYCVDSTPRDTVQSL